MNETVINQSGISYSRSFVDFVDESKASQCQTNETHRRISVRIPLEQLIKFQITITIITPSSNHYKRSFK